MDDNHLRVVLKIHKRSSLEASPSRTWKAQEISTDPSVPNPKRQRTKAISEEHSLVIPSPPKPDSQGASPPADETVAHPVFSSKRKRQFSDSGITDSRPSDQTFSGNENKSSVPLKDGKKPLPEKALCEILDKLQKKDLYGVFSVPVNPAEVPDYFDVISHPMDFSTVRGRVAKKLYTSWDQFEDDVSLIWKNAMIYNAEGTIYYKQAKAMQGIAQKIFPAAGSNELYPRSGFGRGFRGRGRGRGQPGRPKRIPLSDPAQKDTQSGRRILGQRKESVPLVDDKQDRLVFGMDERSEVSLSEDIPQSKPAQGILGKSTEKGEPSQSQPRSSYLGGDDSGNKVSRLKNYKVCRRATSPSGGKHLSFRSWCQSRSCQTSRCLLPDSFALCYSADQDPLAYAHSLARFASPLGTLIWEVAAEKVKQTLPPEVPFGRGWIGQDNPLQSLQSLNPEGESARSLLRGQKGGVLDVSVDDVKQASKQPVRTAAKTSARPAKGQRKSASPHPGSLTKLQVCSEAAATAPIETDHSKSVSDVAPVSSTSESVHGPKDVGRSSSMLHIPHWFNGASRPGAGFASPPPAAAVVSPISAQEALSGLAGVSAGSPSEAGSLSLSNAAIQTLLNSCTGASDHIDRSSVLAMRASAVAALQAANSARQGQSVLSAQALQSLIQGSADVETPTKPLGSALMGALNALWSENASTSSPGAPAIAAAAFGKQGLSSLQQLGGLSSPARAGSTSSSDLGDKNAADHLTKMVEGNHAAFSQNGFKNSPLWAALEAGKIDGLLGSPLNSSKAAPVGDGSGAQALATSSQAAQALAASVSQGTWPGGLPGNAWLADFSSQQQQAANVSSYGSLNARNPATTTGTVTPSALADVLQQQQQGTNPLASSFRPGSSSAARSMMAALDKLKAHHGLLSNSTGASFSSAAFSAAAAAASNHASASASAGLPAGIMSATTGSFANMASMMSAMAKPLDPRSPPSLQQQRQQQQQLKLAEQQHQQQRQKQLLLLQQQQRLQQQRQEQQQQLLHQQQQQQQQRLQQQRQQLLLRQHQASLLQKQSAQNGAQQQQEDQQQHRTPAQQSTSEHRYPQGWLATQDHQQAFQLLAQAQKNKELAELQANKQMPVWEQQQKQQQVDQPGQFQSRPVASEPELRLQL